MLGADGRTRGARVAPLAIVAVLGVALLAPAAGARASAPSSVAANPCRGDLGRGDVKKLRVKCAKQYAKHKRVCEAKYPTRPRKRAQCIAAFTFRP